MIREIKQADVADALEITTNGSLLSKQISEKIVEYGLDIIRFSIYGVDDEENKRVTGSSVPVDAIFENIRYLKECRQRANADKPQIFVKMFDAGPEKNEIFLRRYRDIADVVGLDEVFDMDVGSDKDVYENFYGEEKKVEHDALVRSGAFSGRVCRYLFTHMTIRNDGTVIACCADWLKEIRFGNVWEHTLAEIWNSRSLYELRKKMLETKGRCFRACRACEIPYRDMPEDSLKDISIDLFDYKNEY